MLNQLPHELSFIASFRTRQDGLESARWLQSSFSDPVWKCRFGKSEMDIDFRIHLDDHLLLTDSVHSGLLGHIKRFLCLQTHSFLIGSAVPAQRTQHDYIRKALHVIDYFLLRSHELKIAKHGFNLITANDIKGLISILSQHRCIKSSIYNPLEKITIFLKSISINPEDLLEAKKNNPLILEACDAESILPLTPAELLTARIWLLKNGFYRRGQKRDKYKFVLRSKEFANRVFGNCILSNLKFDDLPIGELSFSPKETYLREFYGVPVNNREEDERASAEFVLSYFAILGSMKIARQHGIQLIPDYALEVIDDHEFLKHGRMKGKGRFTTLPFEVANCALSKAIEFYFEYGEALVDYYVALASKDIVKPEELPTLDIPSHLTKLGVKKWTVNATCSRESFFHQFRSGMGLYQMFQVLIGAIVIITNTLMARRSSELLGLSAASIVKDGESYFLSFNLMKANVGENRAKVLRPLPHIAAEALCLLARLSSELRQLGYASPSTLFQYPCQQQKKGTIIFGTISLSKSFLRLCLDRFCDYVELPLDSEGRRFYIRPHQLRRNFAMLFFWAGSFGGVEVLRYFLGHSKPSMTYSYVTEAMSGKALMKVKAGVAGQLIKMEHKATDMLAQFICARYGLTSDDLHILPEHDVVSYVEDLLATGEVNIEPEFLEGPNGQEFTVIYKVSKLD